MGSMISIPFFPERRLIPHAFNIIVIILIAFGCGNQKTEPEEIRLSQDERYLVRAYAMITEARDLYATDPARAGSLFAEIDSTIDTLRIAKAIKNLNKDPERWVTIFKILEKEIQESSRRQDSKNARGRP